MALSISVPTALLYTLYSVPRAPVSDPSIPARSSAAPHLPLWVSQRSCTAWHNGSPCGNKAGVAELIGTVVYSCVYAIEGCRPQPHSH